MGDIVVEDGDIFGKLYDRTGDEITLDEVEWINIWISEKQPLK